MSTDPVQALIDAGAIPNTPFGPNSRYQGVPVGLYTEPGGRSVKYVLRRFAPRRNATPFVGLHVVQAGERPDGLAATLFGDPELYWVLADANVVIDPFELTDTPGARIVVPAPPNE